MTVQSNVRRLRIAPCGADIFADPASGFVYPRPLSIELSDTVKTYERSFMTPDHDHFPNIRGEKEGSIKIETDLLGFGGPSPGAASAVIATDGENGLLLKSVFGTQVKDTGNTVAAGATTTSIPCTSATLLTVGNVVGFLLAGVYHLRQIRSKASNTLTLDRALPSAPANGATVYASASYMHAAGGHQHLWFDVEGVDVGGSNPWRRYMRGCLGNLELNLDAPAKMIWDFAASDWFNADAAGAQGAPSYPANLPLSGMVAHRSTNFWIGGTKQVATKFGFMLGNQRQVKPSIQSSTGAAGYFLSGAEKKFSVTVLHDDGGDTLYDAAQAGGTFDMLTEVSAGGPGNSLAIVAPVCEWGDAKRTSVNGLDAYELTGRVLRTDLNAGLAAGFPDLVFAIL